MTTATTAPSRLQARSLDRSPSVLMISDRLISLAQDADRSGYRATAAQLVLLAHTVFEDRHA